MNSPHHDPSIPQPRHPGFWKRHPKATFWTIAVLILVWIAAIFAGSTKLLSPDNTREMLYPWIERIFGPNHLDPIHKTIRKSGHVVEYAILALLVSWLCFHAPWPAMRRWWFVVSLAAVVVYASSDEFHQKFVKTRTASIGDVAIDTASGAAALALLAAWRWRRNR